MSHNVAVCSVCHSTTDMACGCVGAVYITKADAARRAVDAHPEKSNVLLAEEHGLGRETIRRARENQPAHFVQVDKRVGRDGKERSLPVKRKDPNRIDNYTKAALKPMKAPSGEAKKQALALFKAPLDFVDAFEKYLAILLRECPQLEDEWKATMQNSIQTCASRLLQLSQIL